MARHAFFGSLKAGDVFVDDREENVYIKIHVLIDRGNECGPNSEVNAINLHTGLSEKFDPDIGVQSVSREQFAQALYHFV